MVLMFVLVFCTLVALFFGGAAAWSDFKTMTIPNNYAIGVAVAFLPVLLAFKLLAADTVMLQTVFSHLMAGAIVFFITFALFHFKMIGGGDAKMLSAFALWAGLSGLIGFLFYTALIGGVVALITLALVKKSVLKNKINSVWIRRAQAGEKVVPYGIAIFIGALLTFWRLGYLAPATYQTLLQGGS